MEYREVPLLSIVARITPDLLRQLSFLADISAGQKFDAAESGGTQSPGSADRMPRPDNDEKVDKEESVGQEPSNDDDAPAPTSTDRSACRRPNLRRILIRAFQSKGVMLNPTLIGYLMSTTGEYDQLKAVYGRHTDSKVFRECSQLKQDGLLRRDSESPDEPWRPTALLHGGEVPVRGRKRSATVPRPDSEAEKSRESNSTAVEAKENKPKVTAESAVPTDHETEPGDPTRDPDIVAKAMRSKWYRPVMDVVDICEDATTSKIIQALGERLIIDPKNKYDVACVRRGVHVIAEAGIIQQAGHHKPWRSVVVSVARGISRT